MTARMVQSAISHLVLGLMFGYATGAIVNILLQLSSDQQVQQFVIWTFSSFGGGTGAQLPLMAGRIALGSTIAFTTTMILHIMSLNEAQGSNPPESIAMNS